MSPLPEAPPDPSPAGPGITVEGLRKTRGGTLAVDGLDLEVARGEIVGLLGPDGAGKTTTLQIVCGLLRPDAGRVTVLGHDAGREARALKRRLGYMPQRFSLYPDLTVAENLRFFADLFGVTGAARREAEPKLLAFSRLGPFRTRPAGALSGGMKQKLALACTLIHTPEVLVLDEPTTGVDPVSRVEFWDILRELAGRGIALLVSTPYMDEASRCDRIVLMHHGRAIERGTTAEIAGRFPRRLLAVRGADLPAARTRLLALGGVDVHRFGDRLHVVHGDAAAGEAVREAVRSLAVEVAPATPSLEDVFVERVGDAR